MEEYLLLALTLLMAVGVLQTSYLVYRTFRKDKKHNSNSIFVDTSVLMDGRILEVAKAGFITGELVIPRTVIGELQLLSDGSDSSRRTRARHGLDVARELRTMDSVSATILQDGSTAPEGVDERLLKLAKKHGGAIMTIDFNLNKVAQVEDINVMNINELAKVIRAEHLPGERYQLELIQKGQNQQQAVGYTKDGIMVVVDNAQKKIGTTVDVEITRAIQTDAGRMLFAKIIEEQKQIQTPKPGITKKLLSSGGRQRTKAVKSQSKQASVQKPTQTPRPTQKPAEKPSSKNYDKKSKAKQSTKSDNKTNKQTQSQKQSVNKPGGQSVSTPKAQAAGAKANGSPRLFSSRSDTEPAKANKNTKPSAESKKPSSKTTKPTQNKPSSPRPKRKNPEDNLMALIDKQ